MVLATRGLIIYRPRNTRVNVVLETHELVKYVLIAQGLISLFVMYYSDFVCYTSDNQRHQTSK